MKSTDKSKAESKCRICGKPASRMVDGEPSCEKHSELIYEDQMEEYIKQHQTKDEWLETKQ